MNMKKPLAIYVVCFIFLVQTVSACSCSGSITPQTSFENSGAVFLGKIIDIREIESGSGGMGETYLETDFEVIESFKGTSEKKITILTLKNTGSNCGYTFGFGDPEGPIGQEYIVYADYTDYITEDTQLSTGACSSTKSVIGAENEINFLRELAQEDKTNIFEIIWKWFSNLF